MNSIKADLKVVLMADDTTIAESNNPLLWQDILVAINSGGRLKLNGSSVSVNLTTPHFSGL